MRVEVHSRRMQLIRLVVASFVAVAVLLASDFFVVYPSVKRSLIALAENETAQIAEHLARTLPAHAPLAEMVESPEFIQSVAEMQADFGVWKLKVWDASGVAIFSTVSSEVGQPNTGEEFMEVVARGQRFTKLRRRGESSMEDDPTVQDVVETYVPIMRDGRFIGAFETYYDVTPFTVSFNRVFFRSYAFLALLAVIFLSFLVLLAWREWRMIAINAGLTERLVRLEKLSALGQLAGGVAHEFNNVLNNIGAGIQRLLLSPPGKAGPLSEEAVDVLKTTLGQVRRGASVASDMLAVARPDDLVMAPRFIEDVIDESIRLQLAWLRSSRIHVVKDYAYSDKVLVDAGHMRGVFLNLVVNAAHAIQPKGKGVITISVRRADGDVEVRLSDTGIGIAPADRHRVFTLFYTTKGAYTQEGELFEGTGLGLAVSHQIVEGHGGTIRFESAQGEGTTFIVTLPVADVADPTDAVTPAALTAAE